MGTIDVEKKFKEINDKIDTLNTNLTRYLESANQQHYETIIDNTRNLLLEKLLSNFEKEIYGDLDRSINMDCSKRDKCIEYFKRLLENNFELYERGIGPEEMSKSKEKIMMDIRDKTQYPQCEACVSEISNIFNKQLRLMQSMNIYSSPKKEPIDVDQLDEALLVKEYLEPLANKQRLQIMKSLHKMTLTFSALSKITGLSGGNLLFHLQKLQSTGMIIQRHERGDYMITEKGYSVLSILSNLEKEN